MIKENILICDDHLICCLGLKAEIISTEAFQRYDVDFAHSVQSAIEALRNKVYSFIFMDIRLPDGFGTEVISQMKRRLGGSKVIFITGHNHTGTWDLLREYSKEETVHAIIQKEHDQSTIHELFRHLRSHKDKLYLCPKTEAAFGSLPHFTFTKREIEVLGLAQQGLTTNEISDQLGCSEETVKSHRSNMLIKTQTRNIAELSAWYAARY